MKAQSLKKGALDLKPLPEAVSAWGRWDLVLSGELDLRITGSLRREVSPCLSPPS